MDSTKSWALRVQIHPSNFSDTKQELPLLIIKQKCFIFTSYTDIQFKLNIWSRSEILEETLFGLNWDPNTNL